MNVVFELRRELEKQFNQRLNHDEMLELTSRKYYYSIYIDGSIRIICDIKPLVYSLIEERIRLLICILTRQ